MHMKGCSHLSAASQHPTTVQTWTNTQHRVQSWPSNHCLTSLKSLQRFSTHFPHPTMYRGRDYLFSLYKLLYIAFTGMYGHLRQWDNCFLKLDFILVLLHSVNECKSSSNQPVYLLCYTFSEVYTHTPDVCQRQICMQMFLDIAKCNVIVVIWPLM